MNIDSLALSVDDSLLMDCSVILQPMCVCTASVSAAFRWPELLPDNSGSLRLLSLFYHPVEVRVG